MRLLHTSDLHYGMTWRGLSRRDDQNRVLAEIVSICDAEHVDALIVAGDVFSDRLDGSAPDVIRQLLQQLRPLLERGCPVVLLRGNHDSLGWFRLLRLVTEEMSGPDRWPLIVADLPGVYRLPKHPLQIIGLPHLSARQLQTEALPGDVNPDRQLEHTEALLGGHIRQLVESIEPGVPAIFAGHFLVYGAQLNEKLEAESGYHRDVWLRAADLPQITSYNAFGHIHKAQEIQGVGKPTYYSGAPDRLDLGERDYKPRVLLVDLPAGPGGVADVTSVPLTTCTRFVKAELLGVEAVQGFVEAARAPAFAGLTAGDVTLGEVTLGDIEQARRTAVIADLERVAPRVKFTWAREQAALQPRQDAFDHEDVPGVVREFIQQSYAEQPERRTRLLAALDSLWDTEPATMGGER